MKLLIIRHGQSEADLLGVHEGRADFPLTPLGFRQAAAMAEWVYTQHPPTVLYSSTLTRALQTAETLADACGLPVRQEDDLREFDNGMLAGLPFEEAALKYPLVPGLPPHESRYGMESVLSFRYRAERVLSRLLSENDADAMVAVVSHGGMINQLHRSLLGLPLDSPVSFATGDTGIHFWQIERTKRRALFLNRTEHLAGLEG